MLLFTTKGKETGERLKERDEVAWTLFKDFIIFEKSRIQRHESYLYSYSFPVLLRMHACINDTQFGMDTQAFNIVRLYGCGIRSEKNRFSYALDSVLGRRLPLEYYFSTMIDVKHHGKISRTFTALFRTFPTSVSAINFRVRLFSSRADGCTIYL